MIMKLDGDGIGKSNEYINIAMESGNVLWQITLDEFNKLLTVAGIESQKTSAIGSTEIAPTSIPATAVNQASQTVNM